MYGHPCYKLAKFISSVTYMNILTGNRNNNDLKNKFILLIMLKDKMPTVHIIIASSPVIPAAKFLCRVDIMVIWIVKTIIMPKEDM